MSSVRTLIGKPYPEHTVELTQELVEGYAHATGDENQRYFGSHALVPPMIVMAVATDFETGHSDITAGGGHIVDNGEELRWHTVMRVGDVITKRVRIENVRAREYGDLIQLGTRITNQRGEIVAETLSHVTRLDEALPSMDAPAAEASEEEESANLFQVEWTVGQDQPDLYAAISTDPNPIHLDDGAAQEAGFPSRILHGLCTLAFAQRAIVDGYLDSDPSLLGGLKASYAKPVFPGDRLVCEGFLSGDRGDRKILEAEVRNQDGVAVLRDCFAEVRT